MRKAMPRKSVSVLGSLTVLILLSSCPAMASYFAISSVSGGVGVLPIDMVTGWTFTVNSSISVTALGVYDVGSDGLLFAHDVGLYRQSSQELLVSTTVPAGNSGLLDGGFRFANLTESIALSPDTYVIIMTNQRGTGAEWDRVIVGASSFDVASEVGYVGSAARNSTVLIFPLPVGNPAPAGYFGPNFTFDSTAVPEPGSLFIVAAGIAGLLIRRRID